RFTAAADSLVITDVLLCAGQSLTGPGQLYRLQFKAGSTAGTTFVRLRPPRARFYNAGLYVLPVETADAEVHIGSLIGVETPPALGLRARAIPNPARAGTTLRIASDRAVRQGVSIYDARGRLVRSFPAAFVEAGGHNTWWGRRGHAG